MWRTLLCRVGMHSWGPVTGEEGGSHVCTQCAKHAPAVKGRGSSGPGQAWQVSPQGDWSGAGKTHGYPSRGSSAGSG